MITISVGCQNQTVKQFTFPGGEVGVQIMTPATSTSEIVTIKAHIKNSDDILALLQVSDAVDRQYESVKKILNLNYVPYARQDRVCNEGESLSIKVFANLINSCGFYKVKILDPHSDVTPALINNCVVKESYDVLKKNLNDYYIVAPDAGAYKKAHKWAEKFQAKGVITANKVRDVRTGNILGVKVDQDVEDLKLFVVDDICDGGRTFIELARCFGLKPAKLKLFVTHGIFSKGLNGLIEAYDHIYTTNSFHGDVPEELKHDKITWINV